MGAIRCNRLFFNLEEVFKHSPKHVSKVFTGIGFYFLSSTRVLSKPYVFVHFCSSSLIKVVSSIECTIIEFWKMAI